MIKPMTPFRARRFEKKRKPLSNFAAVILGAVSRVAQSVYCLVTGWMTGPSRFDPLQRQTDFSSSLCVQTGSGAHPASCTMGSGGPFPGDKARPGRDADHSLPFSAAVENEYELCFLSPQASSWRVLGQL
jgi:hypothetical protein